MARPYHEPIRGADVIRALCAIALVCTAWLAVAATGAQAQASKHHPSYLVTFVARWCPEYTDIFANKQRNDIVESLQDLGMDTQYTGAWAGLQGNPAYEEIPPQTNCHRLPRWQFTLGTGYQTHAVTGVWARCRSSRTPTAARES